MVVHLEVVFRKSLPSMVAIHQALCVATGINVIYDAERSTMANPFDEKDIFGIYEEHYNQITITVGHWEISYLMGVTLRLLREMGGYYKDDIPVWSIYTWQEYKRYWEGS
jgi:hypothetical protein